MDLIAHKFDGRRVAVQHEPIHSYSAALDLARAHYRFHNDTAALYLKADGSPRIVRTYVRAEEPAIQNGYVEVLNGYVEWPNPPTMYPGSLPGDFAADEVSAMLERADRKGYERGFKVGISHRNRERAAQLRRQADSLERTAAYLSPTGRMGFDPYQEVGRSYFERYGVGPAMFAMQARNMGKTWSLEEANQARDRLRRAHPLPGSVYAGVRGHRRPEFTVDLGHNRR